MSSKTTREEKLLKKAQDEARKAGTLPAEQDEHGHSINPHIPEFMKTVPWYSTVDLETGKVGLDHQRTGFIANFSDDPTQWYERGALAGARSRSFKLAPGACENCGAVTHEKKNCLDRPRKMNAVRLGVRLAERDDVRQPNLKLGYDAKRDQYNGFDAVEQMKRLERLSKVERTVVVKKLEDGEKVELPKTSLRVRQDTAKYLRNLDPDSAFYDPKTRSMRANPTPHIPMEQSSFAGDNFVRHTGEAVALEEMEKFAEKMVAKDGSAFPVQANPTALTKARKEFEERKEMLANERKRKIEEEYGSAAAPAGSSSALPTSSGAYAEFASDGRIIHAPDAVAPSSRFDEDVLEGNHSQIWGSYFDLDLTTWGYGCCWQTVRNSFCTGEAGKLAILESRERNKKVLEERRTAPPAALPAMGLQGGPSPTMRESSLYGDAAVGQKFDKKKLAEALDRAKKRQRNESGKGDLSSNSVSSSTSEDDDDWSSTSSEDTKKKPSDSKHRHDKKNKKDDKKKSKKKHHHHKDRKKKKKSKKCDHGSDADDDHVDRKKTISVQATNDRPTAEDMEAYRLTKIRFGDPLYNAGSGT